MNVISLSSLVTCVKFLLLPAYRSTDFEVHRNWLAITHRRPFNKWYFEDKSEWTLDYPPLFAWFEYFLSLFAGFFDEKMLDIDNLNYSSFQTVIYQRLTVIFADLVFIYGVYRCTKVFPKGKHSEIILPFLLIANPGLLMIDHIHFQYNGFLYGLLLLSLANILQHKIILGALWFSILLNFKHIYLYIAPAYFIYLLKFYCLRNDSKKLLKKISFSNILKLGSTVLAVFFFTYAPFYDQLHQVLARLFPFKRGLCHAYWAPNFWALYNFIDKIAATIVSKMGVQVASGKATMTGGLVKEFSHSLLPNITPLITIILTVISMVPALYKLWTSSHKPNNFLRTIVLCALSSFLFGWHVHEKAILMAIIPLSIVAIAEAGDAKAFLLLSTVGHYSLFPLLFPKNLVLIKLAIVLIHTSYAFYSLHNLYPFQFCKFTLPLLSSLESVYTLGLAPIYIYSEFLHDLMKFNTIMPFLPLLITSVYCSIGVLYCFFKYYLYFLIKCN